MELAGEIPAEGEVVRSDVFEMKILRSDDRKIYRVKVTIIQKEDE